MSNIFDRKIVSSEKVGETEDGLDVAEFTFDNGDTVRAVVQFVEFEEA